MEPRTHQLRDGQVLTIREATVADARAILDYIEEVSGESDFLSFGPGEFALSVAEEEQLLRRHRDADNQLYLVATIGDGLTRALGRAIVSALVFTAGRRPRVRHSGEFGLSVRRRYWGLGIGSLMLDTLIDWANSTQIITVINLRVRTDHRRAIRLYERMGFVRQATIPRAILLDGQYYGHHWMSLEL
jgi:RimJ/RimL family protein N-acetyltransferase